MNNYFWPWLCILFIFATPYNSHGQQTTKEDQGSNKQTIIEDTKPKSEDTNRIFDKDQDADQHIDDATMLFHIPGLTLTNNGPLSTSEINYRGLSHARLPVYIDGLSLNNPLHGNSDANAMFLFAAKSLETNTQSLSIKLPSIESKMAKGVLGYGSLNTMKLGGMMGAPFGKYSNAFVAMQASSTQGDFTFSSPDQDNKKSENFTRENNDQHRLQALIKIERNSLQDNLGILLAVSGHEGGLPGFAFSPSKKLRNKALFLGSLATASKKFDQSELGISLANNLFHYHTYGQQEQELTASTHELTLKYNSLILPPWLDFDLAQHLIMEKAYQMNKTRIGAGFSMNRAMRLKGKLNLSSKAKFNMMGFDRYGLLFKKEFSLTIEPKSNFSLTGKVMRSQRLPTFMELYTENSFFLGNQDLHKESIMDFELGSTIKMGPSIIVQVVGFYGLLRDLIVNVPYLSTMLKPINIKSAHRFGLDTDLIFSPTNWLLAESKNSLLKTSIEPTSSPLPNTPWFSGLTKMRLGTKDSLAFTLQSRYKSETFGNIHGTLRSAPYALMDVLVSTNIINHFGFSLSLTNIFNTKTARDTYEMPLPGRLIYLQVEMGNII